MRRSTLSRAVMSRPTLAGEHYFDINYCFAVTAKCRPFSCILQLVINLVKAIAGITLMEETDHLTGTITSTHYTFVIIATIFIPHFRQHKQM
jgi:hypothetical protein